MANAESYAQWIVANSDKKGTPEFETVAAAYQAARSEKPLAATPASGRPSVGEFLFPQVARDALGGLVRGAGSIGATLRASPADLGVALGARDRPKTLSSLIVGDQPTKYEQNRADMDAGLRSMGVDTDSGFFAGGKLAAEVAGTMGVGGALARGAAAVPGVAARAAPALEALRTAGMSAGGVQGAGGVALRAAGGGAAGFAGAGLVNPEDALLGAGIGAVLPGGLQMLGAGGRLVGGAFKGNKARAGETLARSLDVAGPEDAARMAAQLRAAQEFVPGSKPTVAQLLRTPQASILERVVGDSAGGVALKERELAQNAARLAAIERVAPTNPLGAMSAKDEFGRALSNFTSSTDKSMRAATRAQYQSLPQDEAAFYLPKLAPIRDEFFGRGTFTSKDAVDKAVRTAQEIGTVETGAMKAATDAASARPLTLAQAVRRAGGLSLTRSEGMAGELRALRGDAKNLVFNNGGQPPDRIAQLMHEAGYIESADAKTLLAALKDDARMTPQFSNYDLPERSWAAARDAAMGPAPGAERVPKKITLREFDNLRKSIGVSQRGAASDAERATEAAALGKMKQAMDDRINEVVRGDGAIDENLPIAWADALDEARKLKQAQVKTTGTGPQAAALKMGRDGLPAYQGAELASQAWRQGIPPENVAQLRVLIDKNPRLLDQFRGMVTSEGAGTATDAGRLSGKFVKWVSNSLPGLKAAFEPDQVKALQRVAQDIKRANAAAADGAAKGSPTYANASNALSLGLLDSRALNVAANRIPLVGQFTGAGLDWMRETARASRARELAGLLANPELAANALTGFKRPNALFQMLDGPSQSLLRAIPVGLAGDR